MKKLLFIIIIGLVSSCNSKDLVWEANGSISLDGVTPIGIATLHNEIWISDGDHNRIIQIDSMGNITASIDSFERPMHMDATQDHLYIPQYGKDQITTYDGKTLDSLQVAIPLDAPAGVACYNDEVAIADFYNHRIVYFDGNAWSTFGKEGKGDGEFYYPTDVQITSDKIYVADAYNNRVQVFDKNSNLIQIIGLEQAMNAATGIYISDDEIFVTDFENDRVCVYNLSGKHLQDLNFLEKPTDLIILAKQLYVLNYKGKSISTFIKN